MRSYEEIKKVVGVGIGGGGMYYLALFFHYLGAEVEGFDVSESERVRNLKKIGIEVEPHNPTRPFQADIFLYTKALGDELIEALKRQNPEVEPVEVGELYESLVSDYESGSMSERVKEAFLKANVSPLYRLNLDSMKYIGITGTDGKTTTATMIYHILKSQGHKPALISTVSAKIGDQEIDTGFHVTTPSPHDLYDLIKKVEKENCSHVIIEATSHGLSMGRLAGLKFDVAVYTNITEEHLDRHGSWEGVVDAKSKLITRHLKNNGEVILNHDDLSFDVLSKLVSDPMVYGRTDLSMHKKSCWQIEYKGNMEFTLGLNSGNKSFKDILVKLDILGEYNIWNSLAAISATYLLGVEPQESSKSLSDFKAVEGRMQILQSEPYKVIVDFAHTPNALENALNSAKDITEGKLIVVFGCAGQRDPHKRPKMGKIAGEIADVTILTAEDPRTEKLSDINDQIEKGWREADNEGKSLIRFDKEKDKVKVRKDSIKKALEIAEPGDTVIITGKAHEKSLSFGVTEYDWNDIEETERILDEV